MDVTVRWHGHSCFTLSADGYDIVLDPYAPGSVPGLKPLDLLADDVLCSHYHDDHGCEYVVRRKEDKRESPFETEIMETFHDQEEGKLRGANRVHILKAADIKAAHLGDLGCELKKEQKERLKGLDIIMIPVGGFYTIDAEAAKRLVDELGPRIVVPMHYRSGEFGYPVIGTLESFTALCGDVTLYDTNEITVNKDTPAQTAVLKYVP